MRPGSIEQFHILDDDRTMNMMFFIQTNRYASLLFKQFIRYLPRLSGYTFDYCQPGRHLLIICGFLTVLNASFPCQALEVQKLPQNIQAAKIVDTLPWSFDMTRENLTGKSFPYLDTANPPDFLTGFLFVSRNPIQQGNSKSTYLRISFYFGRFGNSNEARKQFQHIKDTADPDIGLSYQWDFVSQSGPYIYHIHGDCLLAEEHFTGMVKNFLSMIDPEENIHLDLMHCRCGGGCRPE